MPPWQVLQLAAPVTLPNGTVVESEVGLFQLIYATTSGAVFASMLAYIAAQYCDVQIYHFWKRLTRGKHLWLRNNFSTLLSQLVDSIMVVTVTFRCGFFGGRYCRSRPDHTGRQQLRVQGAVCIDRYRAPVFIGALAARVSGSRAWRIRYPSA
jgi:hypothetical protein